MAQSTRPNDGRCYHPPPLHRKPRRILSNPTIKIIKATRIHVSMERTIKNIPTIISQRMVEKEVVNRLRSTTIHTVISPFLAPMQQIILTEFAITRSQTKENLDPRRNFTEPHFYIRPRNLSSFKCKLKGTNCKLAILPQCPMTSIMLQQNHRTT